MNKEYPVLSPGNYVDTHCHLDMILEKMQGHSDLDALLGLSPLAEKLIHIACDAENFEFAEKLLNRPDERIHCAMGIHPHQAQDYSDSIHQYLSDRMNHPRVVAWGEMGLDYYYDHSPREIQKDVFHRQFKAAADLKKPVVIHTREAEADTLEILKPFFGLELPIHVHCFTSSAALAGELIARFPRLYIGLTGVITFKSATELQQTVNELPLERILLETDAPFMAPIPHRGKVCHSGMIPHIAEKIAELKHIGVDDVYRICRENTHHMYDI